MDYVSQVMPYRIDGQYRLLNFHIEDSKLSKKVADLAEKHSAPQEQRGFYNMKRAASILEGDRFSIVDDEARHVVNAWSGWDGKRVQSGRPVLRQLQAAYISGKRVNRLFNQVAALKKHHDYAVPLRGRFYNQRNVRVFYRIVPEGSSGADFPIIEDETDDFGFSRIDFFPPHHGRYQFFASTDRRDVEGVINYDSPKVAVGTLTVLPDRPSIAIDIVGLLDQYGFDQAKQFLTKLHRAGYNPIGITPYDDIHSQDRFSALLNEGELSFIPVVHNSFWISDYYETDRGRQEFFGEYLKHMMAVRGVPLVAGVGFSKVVRKGFEIAGFNKQDILVPENAPLYGKERKNVGEAWLGRFLHHLLKEQNIGRYQADVQSMVRQRDSDDYRVRMSWLLNKATASKFTDGNHFSYIRDNSPVRDHNRAAFYAYCDYIKRASVRGPVLIETYATQSDEEGLTIALLLADKAYQSKRHWDRIVSRRLQQLISRVRAEGDGRLADRLAEFRTQLWSLGQLEFDPRWGDLADRYQYLLSRVDNLPANLSMRAERTRLWGMRKRVFHEVKDRLVQLKRHHDNHDAQQIVIGLLEGVVGDWSAVSSESINAGLRELLAYVKQTPRVPIYYLADKTSLYEQSTPAGYHNGRMALEIMRLSGVSVTVAPDDFGYQDREGVIDSLYYRREPFTQLIPCKHTKFAVLRVKRDDGEYEWIALGGGRYPGTKMMGSLNYHRYARPSHLARFMGQGVRNFEDDTYVLKGPVVADIYQLIVDGIRRIRPISEFRDYRALVLPADHPPREAKAGHNRIWVTHRWPWEGVSPADVIWHMIWSKSPHVSELTIVNGFNLDKRWEAQLKHLMFAGRAGSEQKAPKKINIYTGGIGFIGGMIDKPKADKLAQMILWMRRARQEGMERGYKNYQDQVNIYIVKAREFDQRSGRRIDKLKASNQQTHNRIYLLSGLDRRNDVALVGNQNLDAMSIKDREDAEIVWGPAVEQVRERIAELHQKATYLNGIPGLVVPKADGKYLTAGQVYDFIIEQLTRMSPGHHLTSPSSRTLFEAMGNMAGVVLRTWSPKFAAQPGALGMDLLYTPTLLGKEGFSNYHRLDINLDLAKHYGARSYCQLLLGAAIIREEYAGINMGLGFDSIVSELRKEWEPFTARWIGVDLLGSVLIPLKDQGVAGSLRLGITPLSLAFRPSFSRWEVSFRPVQLGLLTHFGGRYDWPTTGLFLGAQLDVRWRDLPPIRDGDLYEALHPED